MNLVIPRKNLVIKRRMSGGTPEEIISNINLNDTNINQYVIENIPYNDNTEKFLFRFTNENVAHPEFIEYKYIRNPPKFLGRGGMTAVYTIKLEKQTSEIYNIPDKYHDSLILRIYDNDLYDDVIGNQYNIGEIDENYDDQTTFINMWTTHKNLFPENIIDLFMYGEIIINGEYSGFYSITRKYLDHHKISTFNLETKVKYFKNLLLFLQKLIDNNYTYRDLKFHNIGAELIDDDYKFIVIDYDKYTILNKLDLDFIKSEFGMVFSVGTYTPFYIFQQKENYNYDYMFVGGLLYTIPELFKELNINPEFVIFNNKLFDYIGSYNTTDKLFNYIRNYINAIDKKSDLKYAEQKIKELEPLRQDLVSYIISKKYEEMLTPNDKLIYLLSKIINNCISLNYDSISTNFNFSYYISIINDVIIDLDKKSSNFVGGYYHKYLKYKNKYLSLKKKYIIY